jgi:ribosomal protein L1
MSICVLGDQHDIDRAKHHGVDAMSTDVSTLKTAESHEHD